MQQMMMMISTINLLSDRLQDTLYRLRVKHRHVCDLRNYRQSTQITSMSI